MLLWMCTLSTPHAASLAVEDLVNLEVVCQRIEMLYMAQTGVLEDKQRILTAIKRSAGIKAMQV